jgi:hypothetical protein
MTEYQMTLVDRQRIARDTSVPPYYTDGLIRKKSHGSEEFLRSYDYQLEDLPKGAIWRKDPVTFHGASHPMCAPRFLGVNSNVNRRKVHEQDDSQVAVSKNFSFTVPFWRHVKISRTCHAFGESGCFCIQHFLTPNDFGLGIRDQ